MKDEPHLVSFQGVTYMSCQYSDRIRCKDTGNAPYSVDKSHYTPRVIRTEIQGGHFDAAETERYASCTQNYA